MTPEMWLELEHTTHRYFLHFAAVRQISLGVQYGVAFFMQGFLRLEKGATSLPVVSAPWLGGLGRKKCFDQTFDGGMQLCAASGVQAPSTKPLVAGGARHAGVVESSLDDTASGPRSTIPLFVGIGAACRCWLGTWPHDTTATETLPRRESKRRHFFSIFQHFPLLCFHTTCEDAASIARKGATVHISEERFERFEI